MTAAMQRPPNGQNPDLDLTKRAESRNGIQVIARAARILATLEHEPAGLSYGEISMRTGLPRSTVQRIAGALADEQMLVPGPSGGNVRLGPLLAKLGAAAGNSVEQVALPVMRRLSETLGETVALSTLSDRRAVFTQMIIGNQWLRAVSVIGERFPLHATANGKALLACLGEHQAIRSIGEPARCTPATDVDPLSITATLDEVRRTGLAWDEEEHRVGICALGTAFLDAFGRPHALSIPVPTARFATVRTMLAQPLLAARAELAALTDGTVPYP